MHRIFTAIATLALVVGLLLGFSAPASAVAGYDSSYFGESAFLNLTAGQSGQFAVGFNNTGSTGWVQGSGSQVDLQVCLANKTTCGVASPNAAWASNWLSSTAYATTTTAFVGPGQTGWFVYNVVAPAGSAGTTARFNGDLALHATGQQVHPQGYYQDASVAGTPPPPGGGGGTAVPSAVSSVSAANLREITVKFNTPMSQTGAGSIYDAWHYTLSGGLWIDGSRVIDAQTVILTVGTDDGNCGTPAANVACTQTASPTTANNTDSHEVEHMVAEPNTFMSQNGTYTLTTKDLVTAAFALTGTASTTFTVNDSTNPTVSAPVVIGAYTFYIVFSEPMDPSATNNGIFFDSERICGTTTPTTYGFPDCNAFQVVTNASRGPGVAQGGIGNLHWQDRSGNDCASGGLGNNGCFQVLRVDFDKRATNLPASGNHVLDIRDAADAAGNKLAVNPTTFTVNLPATSDTTAPTVPSVFIDVPSNVMRLMINFSEAMSQTRNGYTGTDSIDCGTNGTTCSGTSGSNYILRNPDGSAATTGGSSGSGSLITISSIQAGTDNQLSAASPSRFQLKRIRLVLAPVGADNGQGATTTPTLRPNTQYTVEILPIKDEAGNAIAPGTIKTFSWAGDSAAPVAQHAYVTNNELMVDYSEIVASSTGTFVPAGGFTPNVPNNTTPGCTNACDRSRYTSPNSTFNAWLQTLTTPAIFPFSGATAVSFDATGVTFLNSSPLTNGTYELDISGVVDPFGNIVTPNPTIIMITVGATTKPKLLCAGFGGVSPNCANTGTNANTTATSASSVSVRFNEQMTGGVAGTNSAGNPSNYSIDNGTFGALCSAGSPTITGSAVAADGSQTFTITCSGTGVWSALGTHTVTVANVQDLSGNTVDPNPSTAAFTNP